MDGYRDTLVLLHPFPFDGTFWGPMWRSLGRDIALLTPEFPGFGGAPPDPSPTIDGFADHVADVIAAAGGSAVVCGLSLGGYVALSLAARRPEVIRALVLANTRADADAPEARQARERAIDTIRIDGLDPYLADALPRFVAADAEPVVVDRLVAIASRQEPEAVCLALGALRDRHDRLDVLEHIAVPTLVIGGSVDRVTPREAIDTLAERIPGARLRIIEGSGHLTALERPDAFAEALAEFLDTLVETA